MRDFWMPFGPSILEERMDEYLKLPKKSPYMIMAFDTTQKRKDIIATIHPFDNTCRPQTVNELHNSKYVNVIKEFESKTGVGALLNTSFNLHGFPIVYNPEIAIETFQNSKLDYLSLGNYLISK
jgi:carbamoyltransferase